MDARLTSGDAFATEPRLDAAVCRVISPCE
jgi:hypothetical protein